MNVKEMVWFGSCGRVIFIALMASNTFTASASPELISKPYVSFVPAAGGGGDSGSAIISDDGRYVLFASTADNLVVVTNPGPVSGLLPRSLNVFVRDRTSNTTTLASVNLTGTGGGNGDSLPFGISSDSRYVVFESLASDLVAGDVNSGISNNVKDVFVRDLVAGVTELISVSTNGGSGNGVSHSPTMTPDGRYVAFVSAATDLVADDTNGIPDVFIRDRVAETTTVVSVNAKAAAYTSSSESPEITPDGRYVAFYSTATNLVGNTNISGDVYLRDLTGGTTTWVSTNARTTIEASLGGSLWNTNISSWDIRISTNGRYAVFETCLIPPSSPQSPSRGLVLYSDLQSGTTVVFHQNAKVPFGRFQDIHTLDMTPDGRYVAFEVFIPGIFGPARELIYLRDSQATTNTLVSIQLTGAMPDNALCDWPAVDSSGRFVAFLSNATNLVTNVLSGEFNLYVRDLQANATLLVNVDTNGLGTGVDPSTRPALSADGRFVAFDAADGNIVADDYNYADDVFVRDLVDNTTELISVHDPALPSVTPKGVNWLSSFSVSTNGRYVAFASDADNMVVNDTNGLRDVFVRDRLTGTNILVSKATNGSVGSGQSSEPAISGDGRYIAFASSAANLVNGDTNKARDIFVRDLQSGITSLASVSTNGISPGDMPSDFPPSISVDGRYILFLSSAQNLATNTFPLTGNLFLRDQQLERTFVLTPNSSGIGVSPAPVMTPDGRYVLFCWGNWMSIWDSQSLTWIYTNSLPLAYAISPNGQRLAYMNSLNVFVADLPAKTNWVIGTSGFVTQRANPQFSGDSRYLTYAASASNAPNDTNGLVDVYLYDFDTGTNRLISRSFNSSGTPNGVSDSPAISPDGRFIAYRGFASNSAPNDFNEVPDLFLYDRLSDTTILVTSSRSGNFTANNRSSLIPVFSGDNRSLVFQSWASDLTPQDFNNGGDLFALSLASPPMSDSDNDGMGDQWENDHFSTLNRDGTSDFDNDGTTDFQEFQAGTDPTDPTSSFQVEVAGAALPGQGPTIAWPSALGKTYRVQFKNNLNDSVWQDLNGNVVFVGDKAYIIDLSPDAEHRFYRVVLLTDLDGDGMGDQWEESYFETLSRDGTGDFDNDGATDLFEFQTGTIPTDAASIFRTHIVRPATSIQGPEISWPVAPSKSYQVQFKDHLGDAGWQELNRSVTVLGNTGQVTDVPLGNSNRFYRILVIQ